MKRGIPLFMVEDANKTIEFYRTLYVVTKR